MFPLDVVWGSGGHNFKIHSTFRIEKRINVFTHRLANLWNSVLVGSGVSLTVYSKEINKLLNIERISDMGLIKCCWGKRSALILNGRACLRGRMLYCPSNGETSAVITMRRVSFMISYDLHLSGPLTLLVCYHRLKTGYHIENSVGINVNFSNEENAPSNVFQSHCFALNFVLCIIITWGME